jgi:homoserine kinase
MPQVTVRVPASTSNLGPGFDCLGVALRVYNSVTLARRRLNKERHPLIISQAADRFFKQTRRRAFGFSCAIAGEAPRSRGLGGSATIRLGVLLGLNALSGHPLDRRMIFQLCAELEGHPDNAAPSAFGGFVVARRESFSIGARFRKQPRASAALTLYRFEVSSRLAFVLLIPELEVATWRARKILPAKISHAAAVESCANACAITAAFASREYEKLRGAFADRLHQPYRERLVPFLPRVIAAAEKAGALGAFLSGSGSAICAVTFRNGAQIAAAMKRATGAGAGRTIITRADNRGARILNQI